MLTFAIPTWNRVDKVQKCIDSILAQIMDDSIKIAVYDDCSTDDTREILKSYQEKHPQTFYYKLGTERKGVSHSFYNTFHMPETEWTWIMGDDDMLAPGGLAVVLNIIKTGKYSMIHGAETTRCANTNSIYPGTLLDLSCSIGFLDVTGFMSCNIIKSALLRKGYESKNMDIYSKASFAHSLVMMEVLANEMCVFADIPIVELQDHKQTEETIRRWTEYKICMGYNYVADGLKALADDGVIPRQLPDAFFRYLAGNLFGKMLYTFWTECNQTAKQVCNEEWERLVSMTDFLTDESKESMTAVISEYKGRLNRYVVLMDENTKCLEAMNETFHKATPLTYPENYL